MNKTELMAKPYQTLDCAFQDAQKVANETGEDFIIIYTSGVGHEVKTTDFQTNRLYYHGEGGKKMFFDIAEIVHPKN